MNGPVPIGCWAKSFWETPPKFLGMIPAANRESSAGIAGTGFSASITTVEGEAARTLVIGSTEEPQIGLSFAYSRLKTTSSAVIGLPSENFTPGRRCRVQVRSSLDF